MLLFDDAYNGMTCRHTWEKVYRTAALAASKHASTPCSVKDGDLDKKVASTCTKSSCSLDLGV